MHSRYTRRHLRMILAACVTLTLLAGCSNHQTNKSGTFFGAPQSVGDGTAKTYVTVDNAGNPTEVGIRMSAASLNGLPTEDAVPPQMLMLALPAQASATALIMLCSIGIATDMRRWSYSASRTSTCTFT